MLSRIENMKFGRAKANPVDQPTNQSSFEVFKAWRDLGDHNVIFEELSKSV
ncbi:hypothetical protein D3C87_1715950 [compost metagenome]